MGKKLESNFTNMVVVLFSVTLIASAAVGYVYSLTAGPIEAAKQAKQVNAIREVIPGEFDKFFDHFYPKAEKFFQFVIFFVQFPEQFFFQFFFCPLQPLDEQLAFK
jgi:hypothetical protein